jgi:hypothetical protein
MLPIQYNDWQKSLIEEIDSQGIQGKGDVDVVDDRMVGHAMGEICFWIASECNLLMAKLKVMN